MTLYGINCVFVDNETHRVTWDLLALHLLGSKLDQMTSQIALGDVISCSSDLLNGKLRGRSVVDVNGKLAR